jgi:hypothetical protein
MQIKLDAGVKFFSLIIPKVKVVGGDWLHRGCDRKIV